MAMARRLLDVNSKLPKFNKQYSSSIVPASWTIMRSSDQRGTKFGPPSESSSAQRNILPIPTRFSKNNALTQILGLYGGLTNPSYPIPRPMFLCTDSENSDYSKEVDEINSKFAEAREEIEMAMESKETVYFDEEAETARVVVKETLEMFDALLAKLPEAQKGVVQRSMGLKMEQLKAELQQLNE